MKISQLVEAYIQASPEICGSQLAVLKRMAKESIGQCTVPLTAKNVIDHAKLRSRTVCPATVNADIVYLRGMLDYAKHGLGVENVTAQPVADAMPILRRQRLIGESETRTRIPAPDETKRIVARLKGIHADVAAFQNESGRRIGETCRLQWGDLDEGKRTILVRDLKHPRKKSGYNKRAALPDPAFDIIMRQPRLTIMQDERIFKVTAKAFQAAYRKACAAEGIVGLHLHDSRAAVVTRLLDAGYTEPQVMLVTLHDTARMVRSRYNRLKADDFPRRAA